MVSKFYQYSRNLCLDLHIVLQASALQPEHNKQETRKDRQTESTTRSDIITKLSHGGREKVNAPNKIHASSRPRQTQQAGSPVQCL